VASSALPGVTRPVEFDSKKYVDGELSSGFGVNFLRKRGADVVLGLNTTHLHNPWKFEGLYEKYVAPFSITVTRLLELDQKLAPVDLVIDYLGMDAGLLDFSKAEELAEDGYRKTIEVMPQIKELLY
jgi:NTE family protein